MVVCRRTLIRVWVSAVIIAMSIGIAMSTLSPASAVDKEFASLTPDLGAVGGASADPAAVHGIFIWLSVLLWLAASKDDYLLSAGDLRPVSIYLATARLRL